MFGLWYGLDSAISEHSAKAEFYEFKPQLMLNLEQQLQGSQFVLKFKNSKEHHYVYNVLSINCFSYLLMHTQNLWKAQS